MKILLYCQILRIQIYKMVKRECFLKKKLKSTLLLLHLCVREIQLNMHKSNIYNMYYIKGILKPPSIKYLVFVYTSFQHFTCLSHPDVTIF